MSVKGPKNTLMLCMDKSQIASLFFKVYCFFHLSQRSSLCCKFKWIPQDGNYTEQSKWACYRNVIKHGFDFLKAKGDNAIYIFIFACFASSEVDVEIGSSRPKELCNEGQTQGIFQTNLLKVRHQKMMLIERGSLRLLTFHVFVIQDECHNYIKVFVPRNDELVFVCGTNAFYPMCRYYRVRDYSLSFMIPNTHYSLRAQHSSHLFF